VKWRGRPGAPDQARRARNLSRARDADTQAVHGPLQRLSGVNSTISTPPETVALNGERPSLPASVRDSTRNMTCVPPMTSHRPCSSTRQPTLEDARAAHPAPASSDTCVAPMVEPDSLLCSGLGRGSGTVASTRRQFPVRGRVVSVRHTERNPAFATPITLPFTSIASRFVVESVRYTAKLRGGCGRPLRLVASYGLAPANRSDAGKGYEVTSLQSANGGRDQGSELRLLDPSSL